MSVSLELRALADRDVEIAACSAGSESGLQGAAGRLLLGVQLNTNQ